MISNKENIIVTGGAGFIGSNLAIRLSKNYDVRIIDNLSTALKENITLLSKHNLNLYNYSLQSKIPSKYFKNCSTIFHLASLSDVKESMINPKAYLDNNIQGTINLLESMRINDIKNILFTSSSVVYGETKKIVSEKSPTKPISVYGMTKLFCESLIESYCQMYGFKSVIFRLANIVGEKSPKGLIHDMVLKFKKNPNQIVILGNGKQTKSYLHVDDCVQAIIIGYKNMKKQKSNTEIFNVSSKNFLNVDTMVKTIGQTLKCDSFKPIYEKFDSSGRGWQGDITQSKMSISKLEKLNWKPMDTKKTIQSIIT